ncbi:MAG: 3'(2'),5'-bisphosphate nucleotidase CysQ, partial [Aestuariivirgaceae bacterium]|nr:3'(2'),5'-bisphosphate nucleotidase CysQ [Aestuariivirgaceae bacterium]
SAPAAPAENRFWLVDPIDGTQSFAKGDSGWCVAVALIHNGAPELAGIFAPVSGLLYTATAGHGAFCNGAAITTSRRAGLEGARLIANAAALSQAGFPTVERASLHSIALRLCAVASGAQDGMLAIGPKKDWDIAAGDLIVREAGGRASDLQGAALLYGHGAPKRSGVLASGPNLHQEMISRTTLI